MAVQYICILVQIAYRYFGTLDTLGTENSVVYNSICYLHNSTLYFLKYAVNFCHSYSIIFKYFVSLTFLYVNPLSVDPLFLYCSPTYSHILFPLFISCLTCITEFYSFIINTFKLSLPSAIKAISLAYSALEFTEVL